MLRSHRHLPLKVRSLLNQSSLAVMALILRSRLRLPHVQPTGRVRNSSFLKKLLISRTCSLACWQLKLKVNLWWFGTMLKAMATVVSGTKSRSIPFRSRAKKPFRRFPGHHPAYAFVSTNAPNACSRFPFVAMLVQPPPTNAGGASFVAGNCGHGDHPELKLPHLRRLSLQGLSGFNPFSLIGNASWTVLIHWLVT